MSDKCTNCEQIQLADIAAKIWEDMALMPDSDVMTAWERYEYIRDTVDGIICGISRMQEGTFHSADPASWRTAADETQKDMCEGCKRKK